MAQGYEAPASVQAALALLAKHGAAARVLAGGTDLLVQMKSGARQPRVIVDVKRIPELTAVRFEADALFVGAACSSGVLNEHAEFARVWPGLAEAAGLIGSAQIQGRASLGGNLCNASPAADSVPALIANEVVCLVAGPSGPRELPVAEFATGPGTHALAAGELLLGFRIPRPTSRTADAYLRLIPRSEMDIAVVGAAARIALGADGRCTAARIVLGAVAATALLVPAAAAALVGSALDAAALARAAEAARAAARPIDDKRGSVAYRRHVAGVLVARAVAIAAARAAQRS